MSLDVLGKAGLADEELRVLSAWLAGAAIGLAMLLPLAAVWAWFSAEPSALAAEAGLPAGFSLSTGLWIAGGVLALVPVGLLSAALLAASRCFALFRRGVYLTGTNVDALSAFGARIALAGVAGMIVPTLLSLLLSAGAPPGSRALVVSLDSTALLGLIFGGMLWAIAGVMARAVAIADDHAQIV